MKKLQILFEDLEADKIVYLAKEDCRSTSSFIRKIVIDKMIADEENGKQ